MRQATARWGLAVIAVVATSVMWVSVARQLRIAYPYLDRGLSVAPGQSIGEIAAMLTLVVVVGQFSGWLIGRRTPHRWTGPLVQVVAITLAFGAARDGHLGALVPVLAALWLATLLLPSLLLFTSAAELSRPARLFVGSGISVAAGLAVPIVVATHGRANASATWWHTIPGTTVPAAARVLFIVHTAVVVVTLTGGALIAGRHYLRASGATRSLLRPVLIPGVCWAGVTAAGQVARIPPPDWALRGAIGSLTLGADILLRAAPILAATALLAGVSWVELAVPRLRRATAGIVVGDGGRETGVRRFLSDALADPSVRVLFLGGGGGWVDAMGQPTTLEEDPDRAVTRFRRNGEVVGAIEHDAGLAARPEAVELIATVAGLVLERDRLLALSRARVESARALAARLLTSADAAREQLQRVLMTGPIRELDEIEAMLPDPNALTTVPGRLQAVTAEVRHLSHGGFPPALLDGGLRAALTEAAEVPARRFAPSVEITAFLVSAGDPSARLVDDGHRLTIHLAAPPSAPDVLDRIAVLGGAVDATTVTIPVGD